MTVVHQHYEVGIVHVGDTAPDLIFLITLVDMDTLLALNGYGAYVRFWYPGAASEHVRRAAVVDGDNGTITYHMRGDEYPTPTAPGEELHIQWTLFHPDADNGAAGRGYHRTSGQLYRKRVLA
jgi:hypothetical protein